jgi:hypothetical protein
MGAQAEWPAGDKKVKDKVKENVEEKVERVPQHAKG